MSELSFMEQVAHPSLGIAKDFETPSDTLLIAFGGLAQSIGMPPFEFFGLTREIDVKKLFCRDFARAWYHYGIDGCGSSLDEAIEGIQELVTASKATRAVAVGTSTGGYAALVFGRYVEQVEEVHAFAPQTHLDLEWRRRHGETLAQEALEALHASGRLLARYSDLAPLLADDDATTYFVHTGTRPPDRAYAEHVAHAPGVSVVQHDVVEHNVAAALRSTGELKPLLLDALR